MLRKGCALELPDSFTLEESKFVKVNQVTAMPSILEAIYGVSKKAQITILKCEMDNVRSEGSKKGGSLFFEMLHAESELSIIGTKFCFGIAIRGGGMMIGLVKGKVRLENVTFQECKATEDGGGLTILDLQLMNGFEDVNGSFIYCTARYGGGAFINFGDKEIKYDKRLFQNCFFKRNFAHHSGHDVALLYYGDAEMSHSPFDDTSYSFTSKNRVGVILKNGSIKIRDDWFYFETSRVNVDGAKGVDDAECGREEKTPCKTIKKAVENCYPGRYYNIYTSEDCNKHDTEPIFIEERNIELSGSTNKMISLITALDELKVHPGEGLFNVKKNAYFELSGANVQVNTSRSSGRRNGLFVGYESDSSINIYNVSIAPADSKQMLNCILIESRSGSLFFTKVIIKDFSSTLALIFAKASEEVDFDFFVLDNIVTSSESQSVVTVLTECKKCSFYLGNISNCRSAEHKMGGALYLEIGDSQNPMTFVEMNFTKCSCISSYADAKDSNIKSNEKSKGGAIYIEAMGKAIECIELELDGLLFSNCDADAGKYCYISLPIGIKQIQNEITFEMEENYGEENLILVEERKSGAENIIDLMSDLTNRLPFFSKKIYIGSDKASNEKTCGRIDEPCGLISTGKKHLLNVSHVMMLVIDRVSVDKPISFEREVTLTSAFKGSSPLSSSQKHSYQMMELDRGVLRIGANFEVEEESAVFEQIFECLTFEHIDIEYPDVIEGEALDLIRGSNDLVIVDVIFRPWHTSLKGENVLGGEGKQLPYKLISIKGEAVNITQLVVYGRNENISDKKACGNVENKKNFLDFSKKDAKFEDYFRSYEENDNLCIWDSGLVLLEGCEHAYINNSSFVNIGDGAILAKSSSFELNNCFFENNHPIFKNWEKFPSFRHNIRSFKSTNRSSQFIHSLAPGSDGLDGKPFGMLSNFKVQGKAAEEMDSCFFTPVLNNITCIKKSKSNARNAKSNEGADEEISAVIRGRNLFPCNLFLEIREVKNGKELQVNHYPLTESVDETEMKIMIPHAMLENKKDTMFLCRILYSCGLELQSKYSNEVVLATSLNELSTTQLILVIVLPGAFCVCVVVIIIVCILKRKKRKLYDPLDNEEDTNY
eukprot:MONOS_8646.1-p1 / transcript=MONOS_8646.1 / gene=MONOS_8646 / organism=Monocercomonoides_exilis_PA203 / gene_product=unspecified product / transcript_product=unspecified product / location=Mono_scaffold00331:24652-27984(-) / protein_length=1111 / sequence_SO=supercontig / SO=protein_coding / is_pseudo=false